MLWFYGDMIYIGMCGFGLYGWLLMVGWFDVVGVKLWYLIVMLVVDSVWLFVSVLLGLCDGMVGDGMWLKKLLFLL